MDLSQFTTAELVIMIIAGLAALLFGYRIKKIAFFIVWFIIGLNLMQFLTPWLVKTIPEVMANELWYNLLPIAGGLLMALMGFTIEKICLGGIVFALTLVITAQYFGTEPNTLIAGAVVGVVLAGIAVMLMKPAIIIATAITGAYVVTLGVLYWASSLDPETAFFPLLIGIAATGVVFQSINAKHY